MLSAAALTPATASSTVYAPTTIDSILLRSDEIVIGTVKGVGAQGDDHAMMSLETVQAVQDRAGAFRSANAQFRVAGAWNGRVLFVPEHHLELRIGHRYVLFLRGGENRGPWISYATPAYEVRDGVVQCEGGQVYGLGPAGLVCSVSRNQSGSPLSESSLVSALHGAINVARARYPEAAAELDRNYRPLNEGGAR